jgi:four helix bundle protein
MRARSNAEFVSKLEGGLQELEETAYWLELLSASLTVSEEGLVDLIREADELTAILVTCVKRAKES